MGESGHMFDDKVNHVLKNLFEESLKIFYSNSKKYFDKNSKNNSKLQFKETLFQEFRDNCNKKLNSQLEQAQLNSNVRQIIINEIECKITKLDHSIDLIKAHQDLFYHLLDLDEYCENDTIHSNFTEILRQEFDHFYEIEDPEAIDLVKHLFDQFNKANQDHLQSIHSHHRVCVNEALKQFTINRNKMSQPTEQNINGLVNNSVKLFGARVKNADKNYKKLTNEFVVILEKQLNVNFNTRRAVCTSLVENMFTIFCQRYDELASSLSDKEQEKTHNLLRDYFLKILNNIFSDQKLVKYSERFLNDFAIKVCAHFEAKFSETTETKSEFQTNFEKQFNEVWNQIDIDFDLDTIEQQIKALLNEQNREFPSSRDLDDLISNNWFKIEPALKTSKTFQQEMINHLKGDFKPGQFRITLKNNFDQAIQKCKVDEIFLFLKNVIKITKQLNQQLITQMTFLVENKFGKELKSKFMNEEQIKDKFNKIIEEYSENIEELPENCKVVFAFKLDILLNDKLEEFIKLYGYTKKLMEDTKIVLVDKYQDAIQNQIKNLKTNQEIESYILDVKQILKKELVHAFEVITDRLDSSLITKIIDGLQKELDDMIEEELTNRTVGCMQTSETKAGDPPRVNPIPPPRAGKRLSKQYTDQGEVVIRELKMYYDLLMQISIENNLATCIDPGKLYTIHKKNKNSVDEIFNYSMKQIITKGKYDHISTTTREKLMNELDSKYSLFSELLVLIDNDIKVNKNIENKFKYIKEFLLKNSDQIGEENRFVEKVMNKMIDQNSSEKYENNSSNIDEQAQQSLVIHLWHNNFLSHNLDQNRKTVKIDHDYVQDYETKTNMDLKCFKSSISVKLVEIILNYEKLSPLNANTALLVFPRTFNAKEKTTVKEIAVSLGLTRVHSLSQLYAAAIGHTFDGNSCKIRPKESVLVIIVQNSNFECGIFHTGHNTIEMKFYIEQISEKSSINQDTQSRLRENLKSFIQGFENYSETNRFDFDKVIIAGQSDNMEIIRKYLRQKFPTKLIDSDPHEIVTKGASYYAKLLFNLASYEKFEIINKTDKLHSFKL